jgi:iron complex transport system ATP-binding protein
MSPILEMQQASFSFPHGEPLFSSLDFQIGAGDFTALIGPNGAGKTTLLHLLSGHFQPNSGRILLEGRSIAGYTSRERAAILAAVPQNVFNPLPFTVEEVVSLGCLSRQGRFAGLARHDRKIVHDAIASLDLADLRHREFTHLSGGERQRTLIAAALAQQSRIIILDEPTSHLDIGHAAHLMKTLVRLNAETGVTLLIISHDVQTVARFCPQTAILHAGKLIAQGPTAAVLVNPVLSQAYGTPLQIVADPIHQRPLIFSE